MDDRTLAHLRIVVMNKLRRGEPFPLHAPDPDGIGSRTAWIHPAVSLVFHFFGSRPPLLNRAWIEQMMRAASGPSGLTLGEEPAPGET